MHIIIIIHTKKEEERKLAKDLLCYIVYIDNPPGIWLSYISELPLFMVTQLSNGA